MALPLLALALLAPSAASAASCGETAAEVTYCTPLGMESGESINQHEAPAKPHHSKPVNPHSTPPKTEESTETTEPETEAHAGEGHRSKVAPPTKGGDHPGGGKPGSHASQKHGGDRIGPAKSVAPKSGGPTAKGVQASASSAGSSPVLPILAAIVVLAAISIGVVVYRERKGGDGQAGYTGARG